MEAVQVEKTAEEAPTEVPKLEEFLPVGEAQPAEENAPELPKEVQNQIATTIVQGQMAGLSEEEIKEKIKERYGLSDEEAELTMQMIMKYLDRSQRQEYELKKTALGMMPALAETIAQSQNPLAPLIMQRLIEMAGFKEEKDDFVKDIVEAKKQLYKVKMISEVLKDDEGKKAGSFDTLILEMIRQMEREKAEAQKMLYQLLLEERNRKDSGETEALKEALVKFIDAIDQRLEMMMEMMQEQKSTPVNGGPRYKDPLEELLEHQQKLNQLLETLEKAGLVKRNDDESNLLEAQLKLKEFELKQKEVEAKQIFYSKLAEALSNPQTLRVIFDGLRGIFAGLLGRAPSPQTFNNALAQAPVQAPAPTPAPVPKPEPPADIPSLEEFVQQAGGEGGG